MTPEKDQWEADGLRRQNARYAHLTTSERRNIAVGWLLSLLRTAGYTETVDAYNEIVYGQHPAAVPAPTYVPTNGPVCCREEVQS